MIEIKIPNKRVEEHRYIIDVIFSTFWGLDYKILVSDNCVDEAGNYSVYIIVDDSVISMPDILLSTDDVHWLKSTSLPALPLKNYMVEDGVFKLTHNVVPVIYGREENHLEYIFLPIDIFGSCFFMLTRYEEIVKKERDEHGRFIAKDSLAYQENFLDRPIVNEYLEILWDALKKLNPSLKRKERKFRVILSCDVDTPFQYLYWNFSKVSKVCLGDILKRRSFSMAKSRFSNWRKVKNEEYNNDPFYTFDFMMDVANDNDIKIVFNFFGLRQKHMGGDYDISGKEIRALLRRIHSRGHEIGFHASYDGYLDKNKTTEEFVHFLKVCEEEGIKQPCWGARQHYLRWENSDTAINLDAAGVNYDSTLGYSDIAGFRCGTCYEYPLFDLFSKRKLALIEKPLIIMECTITDSIYMGLGTGKRALEAILKYKTKCRNYNGCFTILWHNSSLTNDVSLCLFKKSLSL